MSLKRNRSDIDDPNDRDHAEVSLKGRRTYFGFMPQGTPPVQQRCHPFALPPQLQDAINTDHRDASSWALRTDFGSISQGMPAQPVTYPVNHPQRWQPRLHPEGLASAVPVQQRAQSFIQPPQQQPPWQPSAPEMTSFGYTQPYSAYPFGYNTFSQRNLQIIGSPPAFHIPDMPTVWSQQHPQNTFYTVQSNILQNNYQQVRPRFPTPCSTQAAPTVTPQTPQMPAVASQQFLQNTFGSAQSNTPQINSQQAKSWPQTPYTTQISSAVTPTLSPAPRTASPPVVPQQPIPSEDNAESADFDDDFGQALYQGLEAVLAEDHGADTPTLPSSTQPKDSSTNLSLIQEEVPSSSAEPTPRKRGRKKKSEAQDVNALLEEKEKLVESKWLVQTKEIDAEEELRRYERENPELIAKEAVQKKSRLLTEETPDGRSKKVAQKKNHVLTDKTPYERLKEALKREAGKRRRLEKSLDSINENLQKLPGGYVHTRG